MISAAAPQLIFFAIAFNNTSCSFIIRSISAAEYCRTLSTPQPSQSPKISDRTDHALIEPDRSHTSDSRSRGWIAFGSNW
jgi:hypothetical protein